MNAIFECLVLCPYTQLDWVREYNYQVWLHWIRNVLYMTHNQPRNLYTMMCNSHYESAQIT